MRRGIDGHTDCGPHPSRAKPGELPVQRLINPGTTRALVELPCRKPSSRKPTNSSSRKRIAAARVPPPKPTGAGSPLGHEGLSCAAVVSGRYAGDIPVGEGRVMSGKPPSRGAQTGGATGPLFSGLLTPQRRQRAVIRVAAIERLKAISKQSFYGARKLFQLKETDVDAADVHARSVAEPANAKQRPVFPTTRGSTE